MHFLLKNSQGPFSQKALKLLFSIDDFLNTDLPPRTQDPKIIGSILNAKPIKIKMGFCGMCDSNINNEWILNTDRPFYELRHLSDSRILRKSEVEILIRSLENGSLNDFWFSRDSMGCFVKLIKNIFFISNKTIKSIRRKFYVWKILSSRNRWYRSRRGNLYNPIFKATVYPWNDKWNIARFNVHHEGFPSQKYAKKIAFQMWYRNTVGFYE